RRTPPPPSPCTRARPHPPPVLRARRYPRPRRHSTNLDRQRLASPPIRDPPPLHHPLPIFLRPTRVGHHQRRRIGIRRHRHIDRVDRLRSLLDCRLVAGWCHGQRVVRITVGRRREREPHQLCRRERPHPAAVVRARRETRPR